MVIADAWMAEAAMEGLDLSLVTDMLMLSATSPWTMYIAERNQVHLNQCSQQCNAISLQFSTFANQKIKLQDVETIFCLMNENWSQYFMVCLVE